MYATAHKARPISVHVIVVRNTNSGIFEFLNVAHLRMRIAAFKTERKGPQTITHGFFPYSTVKVRIRRLLRPTTKRRSQGY